MAITLEQLQSGQRAKVTPRELADLLGVSQATLSRWRWMGCGPAYEREKSGRIKYHSVDVLASIAGEPKHKSTSEYQHPGNEKMATARAAKSAHCANA